MKNWKIYKSIVVEEVDIFSSGSGNQIGSALEKKNRNKRNAMKKKSRDWKFCNEKY